MPRSAASILTKAQRERLREDFEELDADQTRRERQRIRERVAAGVFDFRLLAAYPDDQFDLALDDTDDEALRAALIDATVTVERLRELRDYDRENFLADVDARADDLAAQTGAATLEDLDVTPPAELRRETERRVEQRLAPDRWDRRANRSFKLALASLVPLVGIGIADSYTAGNLLHTLAPLYVLCVLLLVVGVAGLFLVRGAQTLKYDVVPLCARLRRDPRGVATDLGALLRKPGQTLRDTWESL